jgi:hypothetical protein
MTRNQTCWPKVCLLFDLEMKHFGSWQKKSQHPFLQRKGLESIKYAFYANIWIKLCMILWYRCQLALQDTSIKGVHRFSQELQFPSLNSLTIKLRNVWILCGCYWSGNFINQSADYQHHRRGAWISPNGTQTALPQSRARWAWSFRDLEICENVLVWSTIPNL